MFVRCVQQMFSLGTQLFAFSLDVHSKRNNNLGTTISFMLLLFLDYRTLHAITLRRSASTRVTHLLYICVHSTLYNFNFTHDDLWCPI